MKTKMQMVKGLLVSDAAEIRAAGPLGGVKLLRRMGGWSLIIRTYCKALGLEASPEDVRSLRAWAQGEVGRLLV